MAEVIVKSIKTDKEPIEKGNGLDKLPKSDKTDKIAKSIRGSEENKRTRAGLVQMAPNIYGKPKVIENGNKVK